MKDSILDLEIRLLVLKYGRSRVLQGLADIENVSEQALKESIRRIQEKKAAKKPKPRQPSAQEVIEALDIGSSEKMELLSGLAKRFDNKVFLPELRDVKTLFARLHINATTLKSRADGARKVFVTLAKLSVPELQRLREYPPVKDDSAFSELAGEIIGSHHKP